MDIYTTITITKLTPAIGINPLQFLAFLPDQKWLEINASRIRKIEYERATIIIDRERMIARIKRNDLIPNEEREALHTACMNWISHVADLMNEVYSQFGCAEIAEAMLRSSAPDISQCH